MSKKILLLDNDIYFDFSRAYLSINELEEYQPLLEKALKDLADLEAGEIVNPDEDRMVGHYWLRDPELAPNSSIEDDIKDSIKEVSSFSKDVLEGKILTPSGERYEGLIYIGIGGSALGPQLINEVLKNENTMDIRFIDNTDPESIYDLSQELKEAISKYLVVVASKSGGTKETANMMQEMKQLFKKKGLDFSKNAIAITIEGSKLYKEASAEGWLRIFPIWDWVGGRTSVASAVGLLPLTLLGKDGQQFLNGLQAADKAGRRRVINNPVLFMALEAFVNKDKLDKRQLVVLPYKDRLSLFAKYLQQLVMESIGKETETEEGMIHEGVAVYGNKGSTDQHSYLQQLFDGPNNFTVHFITVRSGRNPDVVLPNGNLSSDYLQAFYLGTAKALYEKQRNSVTISIPKADEYTLGFLIGVYERFVSFYASFAGVNAYHQPAVEKGKVAAEKILVYKNKIIEFMDDEKEKGFSVKELAEILRIDENKIFSILEYLKDTPYYNVTAVFEGEEKEKVCNFREVRYKRG